MKKMTIKSGVSNVVMPDGNTYQAGQQVVLSDEEASQLTDDVVTNYLTGEPQDATAADQDSPRNESAMIGDTSVESESQKPSRDTTYG